MKPKSIVIESFEHITKRDIQIYLDKSVTIYAIEPYPAYHRKKGNFVGHPDLIPEFVVSYISNNQITLLTGNVLNNQSIFYRATEKAVEVIESVYPEYKKSNDSLIQIVCETLQSNVGANVFKISLCEKLAEFFSVNQLLNRLEELKLPEPVHVYSDTNIQDYLYIKTLVSKSKQAYFEHPNIQFQRNCYLLLIWKIFSKV